MPELHFEDDGEVTRARVELARVDDPALFALMHEALDRAARHRFGAAPEDDGETTFYRGAPIDPAAVCVVEARPGRSAGGWWWFVARIVQGGEEKAHMERRMRVRGSGGGDRDPLPQRGAPAGESDRTRPGG